MLDFHDFHGFSCFFVVTDFIWTVLRCYLDLDVEAATGKTLGLEICVFREQNICSAEKKMVKKKRPKKISAEKFLIDFFSIKNCSTKKFSITYEPGF